MGNKPEYRFQCLVVDVAAGESLLSGSTYLSNVSPDGTCESVDEEVGRVMRGFRAMKDEHESLFYKNNNENENGDAV